MKFPDNQFEGLRRACPESSTTAHVPDAIRTIVENGGREVRATLQKLHDTFRDESDRPGRTGDDAMWARMELDKILHNY